jgi:hypothetical protein
MTLWAAVVAQRLGFTWDESLSLGKAVAGLNAQAKGRRLGIFKPHEQKPKEVREKKQGEFRIEICGRPVPAKNTDEGIRAVSGQQIVDSESAQHNLDSKFGERHISQKSCARRTLRNNRTGPENTVARCFSGSLPSSGSPSPGFTAMRLTNRVDGLK